jgi:hypothetical protein
MNVVSIDSGKKEQQKQDLLDVIDEIRSQIVDGEITEFVAASIGLDGEAQIHVLTKDFAGGVGLYEIGKQIFISQIATEAF